MCCSYFLILFYFYFVVKSDAHTVASLSFSGAVSYLHFSCILLLLSLNGFVLFYLFSKLLPADVH